ncbi:amino acid ABC transporter membrane protein 2 (PAAT family) [Rhizobium sp. PP-F2F-G48]|uniref:ABC transporter permease n=1 Tax=Rhizobium sp. PP-F2F-G48 TaxID=2135651 RepID=UPI001053000E|nr:ABC transporter permease [Rhizobium sp. PP-F2F-G48]TCM50673.1 amino acid ABC transporter membrane protein 2 (PAAT family) [Rhizobium sp. PP-F2F-G48]
MNWSLIISSLPVLMEGATLTLILTLVSLFVGLTLAIPLALLRTARSFWLSAPVFAFTYVMRGTPLLVQLFLVYYGLGQIDWVRSSIAWPVLRDPLWCALIAFSLNHAAYSTEILRGGINAVPTGEVEAAKALGMGYTLRTRRIVLPIAARFCLPAYSNEVILMVKATSLANTVTLMELTGVARKIVAQTFSPYEVFLSAAIVYLALTFAVTRLFGVLEKSGSRHRQRRNSERDTIIASSVQPISKGAIL